MNIKSKKKTNKSKQIVKSSPKKTIVGSNKKPVASAIHAGKKTAHPGKKRVEIASGFNKKIANSNKKRVETIVSFNKKIAHPAKKHVDITSGSNKKIANPNKKRVETIAGFNKKIAHPSKKHVDIVVSSNKRKTYPAKKTIKPAIRSNQKIEDLIEVQLDQEAKAIADIVEEVFDEPSVAEPADNTFDGIANIYSRLIDVNVNFSAQLMDAIKESRTGHPEKVLDLIRNNLEVSHKLTQEITKEIMDLNNKQTDRVIHFNQDFGERINSQLETFFKIPGNSKVLN